MHGNPMPRASLQKWKDQATPTTALADPPDLSLITVALPAATVTKDDLGRLHISLPLRGPDGKDHIRHFLPVHAAIVAALMLADGKVDLRGGSGSSKPDTTWQPHLTLPPVLTTLTRILFGAVGKRVTERKGIDDFRFVVPANYRLSRSPDRDMVLETVGSRDAGLAALLADLFTIADRWHHDELERAGETE